MRKLLNWIDQRYEHPAIYVFENGVSVPGESSLPIEQALNDTFRVNYLDGYINSMLDAINIDKVNVKGYFAWSNLDNFEWSDGYTTRFGLIYVDYANNQTRYLKESAYWYSEFIHSQELATQELF